MSHARGEGDGVDMSCLRRSFYSIFANFLGKVARGIGMRVLRVEIGGNELCTCEDGMKGLRMIECLLDVVLLRCLPSCLARMSVLNAWKLAKV